MGTLLFAHRFAAAAAIQDAPVLATNGVNGGSAGMVDVFGSIGRPRISWCKQLVM